MNPIAQQIASFITDNLLLGQKIDVAHTPSFLEAGVVDSTGVLELVQFLEDTWGFSVDDQEMVPENLDSLERIVHFVEKKTSAQPQRAA
jgi:acyl carrier protein